MNPSIFVAVIFALTALVDAWVSGVAHADNRSGLSFAFGFLAVLAAGASGFFFAQAVS